MRSQVSRQRLARRVVGAVGGSAAGSSFSMYSVRDRRAHEDEVVVEVAAVQDLGRHRVEEGLGELGLVVVDQQADVVQLDLLPDVHRQRRRPRTRSAAARRPRRRAGRRTRCARACARCWPCQSAGSKRVLGLRAGLRGRAGSGGRSRRASPARCRRRGGSACRSRRAQRPRRRRARPCRRAAHRRGALDEPCAARRRRRRFRAAHGHVQVFSRPSCRP